MDYRLFIIVDEEVKGDEFWDYDQQVDLEGFTSGLLYGILAKQSREVTAAIARQKDQVIIDDDSYDDDLERPISTFIHSTTIKLAFHVFVLR